MRRNQKHDLTRLIVSLPLHVVTAKSDSPCVRAPTSRQTYPQGWCHVCQHWCLTNLVRLNNRSVAY